MAQEEKFEEAKRLYETANADQKYVLESLFPELAESEDERIRKKIIATIHLYYGEPLEDEAKEMIAWLENIPYAIDHEKREGFRLGYKAGLEKQGEQKSLGFNIGDKITVNGQICKVVAVEQKPAENKGMNLVEEEMTPFQKKVFCIIDTTIEEEQGLKQVCDELLELASNEIKQSPAEWSEEDEKCIDELIKFFDSMKDCLAVEERHQENRRWLKFLKSLKGTNIMQLPQEWSIEDNIRLQEAIRIVQNYHNNIKDEHLFATSGWCLGWLKSFRPKSQWKPSDEQMKQLGWIANQNKDNMIGKELMTLYNDLKKLK